MLHACSYFVGYSFSHTNSKRKKHLQLQPKRYHLRKALVLLSCLAVITVTSRKCVKWLEENSQAAQSKFFDYLFSDLPIYYFLAASASLETI